MQAIAERATEWVSWRREALTQLREAVKDPDERIATVVYMMISHLRGRLHCRCYQKYHGGWRTSWKKPWKSIREVVQAMQTSGRFEQEDFLRYAERLGSGCTQDWAERLFARSAIETLDDQREFLARFLEEEANRAEWFAAVKKVGQRKPYSWETPRLSAKLRAICEQIVLSE